MGELELSDDWWARHDPERPAEDSFAAVLREIELELGPDHDLFGQVVRVEARFGLSDDVVVRLVDGAFALVHPTWSASVESPPWPTSTRLGDAAAACRAITDWEQWR
ncbi:hypothetical protein [Cellulomonas gelida]|uniref:Uncharacterized protein n=1 Tax=Cellulomonas gelida TaxID=1712 RepID=A0A4Y3KHA7_9CELL|nr:hypothetical protein [Cellulomonas gelida]GEA83811.1 hypothetical protein CGE01nite_10620 [Cellulomonas gelida]GGL32278.1 hypothetical protein GCM10009774_23500 [Cellulomonas gelida]